MWRCVAVSEPEEFEQQVRQKGDFWLANNADRLPKDFWSSSKPKLAEAFQFRCAYTAMRIPSGSGTVDHYLSKRNYPKLAYEWSNYRYAMRLVNGCKGNYDDRILDPFEVENDWFMLQLPDLELGLTDKVPVEMRSKAEFTLDQLQLRRSPWIIAERAYYYDAYCDGNITIAQLEKDAPLIAQAIHDYRQA